MIDAEAKTDPAPPLDAPPESFHPAPRDPVLDRVLTELSALRADVQAGNQLAAENQSTLRTQAKQFARYADILQTHLADSAHGNGLHGMALLYVEDANELREVTARQLKSAGANVQTAKTVTDAVAVASGIRFDVMILDDQLPDGLGTSLAVQLRKQQPDARIIVMSAYPGVTTRPGTVDVVMDKPVTIPELKRAIRGLDS